MMIADGKAGIEDLERLRASAAVAMQAAQDAIRDTTRLTRMLTILGEPAPLDRLLDRILAELSELFSADIVVLLDPARLGTFSPQAAIGLPEDLIELEFSNEPGSIVESVLRTQQPVRTASGPDDLPLDQALRALDVHSSVYLPVSDSQITRGVLILARCHPTPFVHADVYLLSSMAHRIGLALEQAQRNVQLERVVSIGRDIARHLDESTVKTQMVRFFPEVIGAEAGALVLIGQDGDFHCVSQYGLSLGAPTFWAVLSRHLLSGSSLVEERYFEFPDLGAALAGQRVELPEDCPVRALLAVPIRRTDRTQGLLFAFRTVASPFSAGTQQMAMLFARQASAALENAQLYKTVRDELAERRRADEALRANSERFRALIRSVSDVITILAANGSIRYASPAVESAWNTPVEAILGKSLFARVHPDDRRGLRKLFTTLLNQPKATLHHAVRLCQAKDVWRDFEVILTNLLDEPAVGGIVATFHDITERKSYEQQLTQLAFRDPLTGLANRAFFADQLNHALERSSSRNLSVGIIFFDLDNFKLINDSLGHACGDQVLRIVADRVRTCLRRQDIAARLGGDEFTILVEEISSVEQVLPVVRRLTRLLREPILLEDRDMFISASLGIALSTPRQDTSDDVLRKADLAMYAAKNNGKGCYAIYDSKLNTAAVQRLELETDLRWAFERKELEVYYQPVYHLESGQLAQVEAMVFWNHPSRGLVSPDLLLPSADEAGLRQELDQWALNEACCQMAAWQAEIPTPTEMVLSLNISTRQLLSSAAVTEIQSILQRCNWHSSQLVIEFNENHLAQEPDSLLAQLGALKDLGVRLAIDSFGTAYSSLAYLKQLPVDFLKIDETLTQGVEHDERNLAVARGILAIANIFQLGVVGNGIETAEQAKQLNQLGCRFGQGGLYSPPLPARAMERLLRTRSA